MTVLTTGVSTRTGIGGRRHRRQRRTLPSPTRLRLWQNELGWAIATSPGDAWDVMSETTGEDRGSFWPVPRWTPWSASVHLQEESMIVSVAPAELIRTQGRCFIPRWEF